MTSEPLQILLVEDNPADVDLTVETLEELDVRPSVRVVRNGEDALKYLQASDLDALPRFIILDLNLPRVSGLEVLRSLKSDPNLRRIPVLILTSSSAPKDVRAAYDDGANCYVTKPADVQAVETFARALQDFWFRVAVLPSH